MKKDKVKEIAQVLRNKIYNENIRFYEQLAYEGQKYDGHVLTKDIAISDIEKAITNKEDLNKINGLPMNEYINIDLNAFLTRVVIIREHTAQSYAEVIAINPVEFSICFEAIMECFTEKEKNYMKRIFLKRMLNFENIVFMEDNFVDDLFYSIFNELKREENEILIRNLR